MNRRFLLALAGAIFFGVVSIYAAKIYLVKQVNVRFSEQTAQQETEVVMAAVDIPLGSKIEESQISVNKYPKRLLPEGPVLKREEVIGRVAMAEITARTPILERQLSIPGAQAGLPGIMATGMRAVSVRVDEASSVGGFVVPGAYVDIIAILQPQVDGGRQVSKVILQKIRVLAGGQQMQNKTDGKPALVNTVTLEVTPNQAEKLKLAEAEGRLQLSIRNAADQVVEETRGATRRDVINDVALEKRSTERNLNGNGGEGVPRPAPAPPVSNIHLGGFNPAPAPVKPAPTAAPRPQTIELIQGSKRSQVEMAP
ncbi:MAG TPA: Flp pilus assembly protein CpaB [Blastocatellia bacterium]|nr:Flp pilus assembly protein CpaB [Blastocatellia bacterium]